MKRRFLFLNFYMLVFILFLSINAYSQLKLYKTIPLDLPEHEIKSTWYFPESNNLLLYLEKGYFDGKIDLYNLSNNKVVFTHPTTFYIKTYDKEFGYETSEYTSLFDINDAEINPDKSELLVKTDEQAFYFSINGDTLNDNRDIKPLQSDEEPYVVNLDISVIFNKKLKAYTSDDGRRLFLENPEKKEVFGIDNELYANHQLLSFSPDGNLLLALYGEYNLIHGILMVNPINGKVLYKTEPDSLEIPDIHWISNNSFLCVSKNDKNIGFYKWNPLKIKEDKYKTIVQNGHLSAIKDIDIHKNDKLIASLDEKGKVIIWDIKTGLMISSFIPKEKPANIEFVEETNLLVRNLSNAAIYNYLSGEKLSFHKLERATKDIDSENIIYGIMDTSKAIGQVNKLVKYDIKDQKIIEFLPDPITENSIWELVALPIEKGLLCIDWNNNLHVLRKNKKWIELKQPELPQNEFFFTHTISPDGKYLALGSRRGNILIYEIGKWKILAHFKSENGRVKALAFDPGGEILISSSQFGQVTVWEWKRGITKNTFLHKDIIPNWLQRNITYNNEYNNINALDFSADYLISASDRSSVKIWDRKGYKLLKTLESQTIPVSEAIFNYNDIYVASAPELDLGTANIFPDTILRRFSFGTDIQIDTISQHYNWVNNLDISSDGKWLVSADNNNAIVIKDLLNTNTPINWLMYEGLIEDIQISPNGKYIAWFEGPTDLRINVLKNGDSVPFKQIKNKHLGGAFHLTNKRLFYSIKNKFYSYSLDKHKTKNIFKPDDDESSMLSAIIFDSIRKNLLYSDGTSFYVASLDQKKIICDYYENSHSPDLICFHPKSNVAFTASSDISTSGNSVIAHNLDKKTTKWINKDFQSIINSIHTNDDSLLIVSCTNGELIFLNSNNGTKIATMVFAKNTKDFIIFTPDQYYYSSKEGTKLVGYLYGNKILTFEQLDLQYNRPDLVFSRIGLTEDQLLKNFALARNKRLSKMGFRLSDTTSEMEFPDIEIVNKEQIPLATNEPELNLDLKLWSDQSKLDRLNIWINNVPLYGMNGIKIRVKDIHEFTSEVNIPLSSGENKIQLSCHNQKGFESFRETFEIKHEPSQIRKSHLYLIPISVSDYMNNSFDLKYADKDGRDLQKLFSTRKDNYILHFEHALFNKEATRENILALKKELLKTHVDDQVILYVSGHGLLDDNFDFYFATHDIDFNNPSERGVSYDELEWLLDSIPARKKLFLMDACHSGEVDKEELMAYNAKKEEGIKSGVKKYTYRADVLQYEDIESHVGLQNSFELMQELFTNLNRGSGAVVISAAAGDSYAMESDEWQNGVFTYSILQGLQSGNADANQNGEITVSELRDYVSQSVQDLTNGLQKPTMRQENVEFDYRVW